MLWCQLRNVPGLTARPSLERTVQENCAISVWRGPSNRKDCPAGQFDRLRVEFAVDFRGQPPARGCIRRAPVARLAGIGFQRIRLVFVAIRSRA